MISIVLAPPSHFLKTTCVILIDSNFADAEAQEEPREKADECLHEMVPA